MSYKDVESWNQKWQQVEQVEACGDLINLLSTHLQNCVSELSKEKQTSKVKMEEACQGFKNTLKEIEDKLDKVLEDLYLVSSAGYTQQSSNFEALQKMALVKSTERFLHEELRRMHDKHFASDLDMVELDVFDSPNLPFSDFKTDQEIYRTNEYKKRLTNEDLHDQIIASTSQAENSTRSMTGLVPIRLLPHRRRITPTKSTSKIQKHSADDYMRFVADRFVRTGNNMLAVRKCTEESMSDAIVLGRLEFRGDCDLNSLMCIAPLCGRTFDSLQVLAYHLSYSHQNSRLTEDHEKCLVCGQNIGGEHAKRTHLLRKHNDLSKRHNEQCLEQRGTVIAPEAPAAKRIFGDRPIFPVSTFQQNSSKNCKNDPNFIDF